MSLNASSFLSELLSAYFDFTEDMECFITHPGSLTFTIYFILNIFLVLPLCIFILHHGLQQCRTKTSTLSPTSHSDSFTYHMVTMELIGIFGSALIFSSIFNKQLSIFVVGFHLICFTWYGQAFFHVLTCVERYLAVVHPITYLSLRTERGIRVRNITIGCVWLLCVALTGCLWFDDYCIADLSVLILCLIIVSFCSLSVLCVLIHPGPGDQGGGRERVDPSKQRAFYTIMVILGVLVVRFTLGLAETALYLWEDTTECLSMMCEMCSNLLCSLVLPLLFLHRAGKLGCCKNNVQ